MKRFLKKLLGIAVLEARVEALEASVKALEASVKALEEANSQTPENTTRDMPLFGSLMSEWMNGAEGSEAQ